MSARSRAPSIATPSKAGRGTSRSGRTARGGAAPSAAAASRAALNAEIVARRVAAARAAEEPRDPDGRYHELARDLADRVDRNVGDLLDEWDERAAVRQYDAGVDRATAEALAWDDTRERYEAQGSLL